MSKKIFENVFQINNPSEAVCKLVGVADPHWTLAIQVYQPTDNNLFLQFGHVAYFSGRTAWKGAEFRIAGRSEYHDFIKDFSEEMKKQLENYYLFVASTSDGMEINIIAAHANRSDDGELIPYNLTE